MKLSIYILLISQILIAYCNYTLVPSQVLLPRTSFYRCKKTNQLLSVTVQFVLKIEPSLCVNWKLQDSDLISFDKSNYTALQLSRDLEDSSESEIYPDNEFKGCSPAVVLTTLPLNLKDEVVQDLESYDSSEDGELKQKIDHLSTDVRTFVFAYDSKFRFHAVTEVVISKLDRLTVETAYRKVSKNQVFSLKLRGLDREGNTFSSLEGLPFYLHFSGPRIFDVLEVKEGELYSEKRSNVLSQNEYFTLPEGTTLVTDVVLLKGVKVGKSILSFGLVLPEYSQVVSAPLEFVVNDFVVLSHQNLYMLNNTYFKLKLQYPINYLFQDGMDEKVDESNYEWFTDSDFNKLTINNQGVIEAHVYRDPDDVEGPSGQFDLDPLEKGYNCVVYARDLRTGEVLKSYVSVMKPHSLVLKYSSMQSLNNCLVSKNLMSKKDFEKGESFERYLQRLSQMADHEECFEDQDNATVYLYEGGFYVFKFNLFTYNKNLFNTFDGEATKFVPTDSDKEFEDDELLKLLETRENYYLYKAKNLGCDYYNLVHTNSLNPEDVLVNKYKLCVLEQIKLEGYECNNKHKLQNNYDYFCCERPLVVSVGDMFEVNPQGGSGKFKYELEGSHSESNKFVCSNKGSYQLKITDLTHEENGLLIQVIATTVASSEFEYTTSEDSNEFVDSRTRGDLTIRLKKVFKLKLDLYANLSGFSPKFKRSFSKQDEKFYSFNYFNDGNHLVSLRQKYENLVQFNELLDKEARLPEKDMKLLSYDRKVLELKSVSRDETSLVLTFLTLSSSATKFGLNLELLRDYYRGQFGDEESALGDLKESSFQTLMINVYKDPELYINAKYRIPIINLAPLTQSESKAADGEKELLANVALGGRVELNYKFGLSQKKPSLTLSTNNNVLYMENLDVEGKNRGYMLYCVNLGYEELVFELLDYKKSFRVSCSFPMYNRVYPVTKLSSNLYELADTHSAGGSPVYSDKFFERKYKVNSDRLNRYINLMFDSNNNLLLPSDLYQSTFQVYALASTLTVTTVFWDKSINEQSIYMEDGPILEFLPSDYDGAKRELKIVGRVIYSNDARNYSEGFNKVRKYRKMNQLINSVIKSRWSLVNKHYHLSTYILVSPKVNPTFGLAVSGSSKNDIYVMYNKMFVYRVFVTGGSGNYSLVNASNLTYRFSRVYIFPNALKGSEKLDDSESLPELENDKFVLVNLFNFGSLKGAGRFLTFAPSNMNDLLLVLKDDKLLWQKSLDLKLHFKYPNRFKLVLEPLTYENSVLDKEEFELVEGKEELLYVDEKYKLRLSGYYDDHQLLENTTLWVFAQLNNNLGLRSTSAFKDYSFNDHLMVNEDEVLFRGSDELVMSTFELGSGGLAITDLDKSMKKVYKFRLVNKLMLDYSDVTVLTNTKFDITFKNLNNYNNLQVTLSRSEAEGSEQQRLEKYGLSFSELGSYKYRVGVMYNNNVLTYLDHELLVNVSKPMKMLFYLSGLSGEVALSSASKMSDFVSDGRLNEDENVYEYTVDKNTAVNLNVLLFDENGNLFTPLYLSNSNLEFLYQLTDSCYLLSPELSGQSGDVGGFHTGGGVTSKLGSASTRVGGSSTDGSKSDSASSKDLPLGDHRSAQFSKELVTNRYNVLLFIKGECEVVVTTTYLGLMNQSKKLKFRIRAEEKLFGTTEDLSALFDKNYELGEEYKLETSRHHQRGGSVRCGVCCGRDEEDNLCYGGVYEINKSFKSYPENKLKYLGNRVYQVGTLGNVLIMTDLSTYNLKLLKPTHFLLRPLSKSCAHSESGVVGCNASGSRHWPTEVDFVTHNMGKLVFKLELYSNGDRLKMPKNAHFRVSVKDWSVFTYEWEDELLTLTPHKYGETSLELVYSLGEYEYSNVGYDEEEDEVHRLDMGYSEINRYYLLKSTYHDVTSVLNVMTGSRVYLTGSRVNALVVNLDVNSYEFTKFIKNKFTVKSFGACFNEECGMVYMNRREYVNTLRKLKTVLSLNRASYKLLLNLVTNSLNELLNVSNYRSHAHESQGLLSVNQMVDTARCSGDFCWLELKYVLSSPISVESLSGINNQLHANRSYALSDEVGDVLRMLCSPLMGVDNNMWNSGTGVVEESCVEPIRPSKYKFKNVNNEEVVVNVTHFSAGNYKFKQVDSYTLLLLPNVSGTFKSEEGVLGNHANVVYFNYGLSYKFSDPQLNKLYFLKPTYYPYFGNLSSGAGASTGLGAASAQATNTNEIRDATGTADHKYSKGGVSGRDEFASSESSKLVYRLGYSVLLSNNVHKEWNVFKNHLRTMSTDALKGKHKLTLELHHYKDSQAGGSGRDSYSTGGGVGRDEHYSVAAKEEAKQGIEVLLSDEVEVDLPENILFVNSDGFILNELAESNMNNVLHVYPANSSYKLYLNSNKYVVKTVERSGQLTTFIVYSNVGYSAVEEKQDVYKHLFEGEHSPANVYLMVLNSNDSIVGKIRVSVNVPASTTSVPNLGFWKRRSWPDVVTLVLTFAVGLFVLFVYNTIRNYQYYQPAVPIKLERSLPKVFENLQQTGYNTKYYHSLR